ncbi:tyrosine-type recombinase/integrase, partial [Aeromonas veronii]|nr:tyrosine-type recombinase/integrase [Aeromonas veronii]
SGILKDFIDSVNHLSITTLKTYKGAISDFLNFYVANFEEFEIREFNSILKTDIAELKITVEKNKYPNIPEEFFSRLLSSLIRTIENLKESESIRSIACMMIILTQTGLRSSELTALKINSIGEELLYDGKTAYYLKFKTWKREKGNNIETECITFINDISKRAFDTLTAIHEKNRKKHKSNLLFVPERVKVLPVDSDSFLRMTIKYYFRFAEDIGCLDSGDKFSGLKKVSTDRAMKEAGKTTNPYKEYKTFCYPVTHQYRVYLCTDLYNKGVPLSYIQKYMTHLTSDMQDYYVRPTQQEPQETPKFSTNFF